ncbi:MAG: amino acid adenylation domain-containing protein [Azospirillaceae bacterium]|nr:amino acid adenylation domain-containing protein [Azospirillaceae bacterium]
MTDPDRRPARAAVAAVYPLLPLQQGLLFHELLEPEDQPYFRQVSFWIVGDGFDPALCAPVWNALMARHPLLRSIFDYQNTAHLVQLVLKQRDAEFAEADLSGLGAAAQSAHIAAWRAADRARGFDLRHDPLIRVQLFRLGGSRFEMVWSHPHILLDGWSGSILLAEFAELYAARRSGRAAMLAEPPSYQAYLDRIAARDDAASRQFWADALAGYDTLACLPRLGPDPAGRHYQPRDLALALSPARDRALADLARRAGVTLNTVLQAIWGLALGRYNDSDDVVFGAIVSGRTLEIDGIERMVGAFINTIPVRVTVGADDTMLSLLERLQRLAIDALAHDHLPLAEIQAASALPARLLDHLLVFENYPDTAGGAMVDPGLGFQVVAIETDERAHYDFGVLVQPGPPLCLQFKYNGAVHSDAQIARLGDQILTLIDAVTADPMAPVRQHDIINATERATLARFSRGADGTTPGGAFPEDASLVDLWRAQVARTPDHAALVFGETRLSYRALDAASDALATALHDRPGGVAQQPVGLLAARGAQRIVGLLGILKAGGVYLPLSPALPDERLGLILDDTACRLVLGDAAGRARLAVLRPGLATAPLEPGPVPRHDSAGLPAGPGPRDLAYIIYTSGSTGRPKGVLVEHHGFVNMITQQIAGFGITASDRVLQFASCSFDASLSEIFMALLAGACLMLADEDTVRDGEQLLALMAAQWVSVITLPPSYLAALERPEFPGLRVLITAGEAVDANDARHYAARLRVFNAYGPTEASVCASFHEVAADEPYPAGIPIGRPLGQTTIRILDHQGREVPIGAPGELCLSGVGLARGYHNRPDLTARAFVNLTIRGGDPDPAPERFYRTGDIGSWLEDGTILYQGRRDGQVKLNGRRIEPGEIESVLRSATGIQQAAVIVVPAVGAGGGTLIAYIVAPTPPDPVALRQYLAARLPSAMIPATIIAVPMLPRTLAGKLDRKALPPPPGAGDKSGAPPATEVERRVATAFETILGRDGVGRDDHFAALGGDSLSAIRVVGRLHKQGYRLALRDLLRLQSVAAIAAVLAPRIAEAGANSGTPIVPAPAPGDAAPLTPIQATFFAEHRQDRHHFNHTVLLRAGPRLDGTALQAAIAALWRHHDALRLRFRIGPDGITQSAAAPEPAPVPVFVDLRDDRQPWPGLIADAAARQDGFDLESGPLVTAVWYRLDAADFLLLLAHHLVIDAVSWRFVLEDLGSFYRQAAAGQAVRLPAPTLSYRDWAWALEAERRSARLRAAGSRWSAIDATPVARLATDFPIVAHHYHETEQRTITVPTADPRTTDDTVQVALLAALSRALIVSGMVGEGKGGALRVLLTSHGRLPPPGSALDVSRTVGWFTAEYPVLLPDTGDPGAIAALPDMLEAAAAQALDYGLLPRPSGVRPPNDIVVNYLGRVDPDRHPTHPDPLFQIVEDFDGASAGRLERTRLLGIDALRRSGHLTVGLRFCPRIHRPATIERLAQALTSAFADTLAGTSAPPASCHHRNIAQES